MIPVLSWFEGSRQRVRILMFHGVGVPDYPAAAFERQLMHFARAYDVVSIDQALQALASNRPSRRRLMVLTFDDGLRNNHTVAYPLLARLGLPAVFYVCPGLIERGEWLWNQDARARLRSMSAAALEAFAARVAAPSAQAEAQVGWMKSLDADRLHAVLGELRDVTAAFVPSTEQRHRCDVMSWQELRSLDPRLVTVGSHTVSHPILTGLDAPQLHAELVDSRSWLEERLGRRVEHFCYPNGGNNAAVRAAVSRHYTSAVTTWYGYAQCGDDLHQLRRVATSPKRANMAWRLHRRYPDVQ